MQPKLPKLVKIDIEYVNNAYTLDWGTCDAIIIDNLTKRIHNDCVSEDDIKRYYKNIQLLPHKYEKQFNKHAYYLHDIQLNRYNKMCDTFEFLYDLNDIDALDSYKKTFAKYLAHRNTYIHEHGSRVLHVNALYQLIMFKLNLIFSMKTLDNENDPSDFYKKDIDEHALFLHRNYGTFYYDGLTDTNTTMDKIIRNIKIHSMLTT